MQDIRLIYKSQSPSYTSNEQVEFEIKLSFIAALKQWNINVKSKQTEQVRYICWNYEILNKEFFPPWLKSEWNPNKNFSKTSCTLILKFTWKGKRPRITNTILKTKPRRLTPPNLKTGYKTIVDTLWKSSQKTRGGNTDDLEYGNDFLDTIPRYDLWRNNWQARFH